MTSIYDFIFQRFQELVRELRPVHEAKYSPHLTAVWPAVPGHKAFELPILTEGTEPMRAYKCPDRHLTAADLLLEDESPFELVSFFPPFEHIDEVRRRLRDVREGFVWLVVRGLADECAVLAFDVGDGRIVVAKLSKGRHGYPGTLKDTLSHLPIQLPLSRFERSAYDRQPFEVPEGVNFAEVLGVVSEDDEVRPTHVVAPLRYARDQTVSDFIRAESFSEKPFHIVSGVDGAQADVEHSDVAVEVDEEDPH